MASPERSELSIRPAQPIPQHSFEVDRAFLDYGKKRTRLFRVEVRRQETKTKELCETKNRRACVPHRTVNRDNNETVAQQCANVCHFLSQNV